MKSRRLHIHSRVLPSGLLLATMLHGPRAVTFPDTLKLHSNAALLTHTTIDAIKHVTTTSVTNRANV